MRPNIDIAVLVAIGLGTLFAYWPALTGPRIFDDLWLQSYFDSSLLSLKWWRPESRPLVTLSFITQGRVLGDANFVSRLVNVGILATSGFVLYKLLNICLKRDPGQSKLQFGHFLPAYVAMIWSLHPIQTQSTAYIIQRGESLMGLFYFTFLLCLSLDQAQQSRNSQAKPNSRAVTLSTLLVTYRWQFLAILSFILGISAKTVMVTALVVGPLFDRAFLSQSWAEVWRSRGLIYIIPIAIGIVAISLLIPGILVGAANVGFGGNAPPMSNYMAGQSMILWRYLLLIIAPSQQSIDWGFPPPAYVSDMWAWIALSLSLLAVTLYMAVQGRWKWVFWLAAPIIVLLPTSSVIPTADLMVEHRLYVPSAIVLSGLAYLVLSAINPALVRSSTAKQAVLSVSVVYLLALSCITWLRCHDYQSGYRIWSQAVMANPANNRAIQNAIDAADIEHRQDEIIPLLLNGIAILEQRGKFPVVPLQRLGETLGKIGEHQKAIATLEKAIELDEQERASTPGGYVDIQRQLNRSANHINLAIARHAVGQTEQALYDIEQAIHYAPLAVMPRAIAGQFYRESGRLEEALVHFERASEIDPNSEAIRDDLVALRELVQAQRASSGSKL